MSTGTPKKVTLNDEQRHYVIPSVSGFSCLGYDNCFNHVKQLADILNQNGPQENERGTLALYERYQGLVGEYGRSPRSKETYFDPNTSPEVKRVLEDALKSGRSLRWFLGDAATGCSWLEENDVEGTIGRSMGPMRSPLGISKKSDLGGGALLTAFMVRILDAKTKEILYSHHQFHLPEIRFKTAETPGYLISAEVKGEKGTSAMHASFKTKEEAAKWATRITGAKPGAVTELHMQLNSLQVAANDAPLPDAKKGPPKNNNKKH